MEIHGLRCDSCGKDIDHEETKLPHKWMRVDLTMGNESLKRDMNINSQHICPDCVDLLVIMVGTKSILHHVNASVAANE